MPVLSAARHGIAQQCPRGDQRVKAPVNPGTYCEAPVGGLAGKFGRAWLIAAVARALVPDCKADNALVLEGAHAKAQFFLGLMYVQREGVP